MLVSFVYVVACRLLALVVLLARSDRSKELELPKAASGERKGKRGADGTGSSRVALVVADPANYDGAYGVSLFA